MSSVGCPPKIRREVTTVFPQVDLDRLLIVPTCQHAAMDLVQTGERVDVEKDNLLEKVSCRCCMATPAMSLVHGSRTYACMCCPLLCAAVRC